MYWYIIAIINYYYISPTIAIHYHVTTLTIVRYYYIIGITIFYNICSNSKYYFISLTFAN